MTEAKQPVRRKRRRADGTLRPTVARRRKRDQAKKSGAERKAWLARFAPGARAAFFEAADLDRAQFLGAAVKDAQHLAAATGDSPYTDAEVSQDLARLADRLGWLKLATSDGYVVGIAPSIERRACANVTVHRPHRWTFDGTAVYCAGVSSADRRA